MPSYNQAQYIEESIRSVLLQGYPDLEYVIIDGGSNDGSVEIIQKYTGWLHHWVSEPDQGQADAIAKGLRHSTGELFNWINSDDLLTPSALTHIAAAYKDTDLVAGACTNFSTAGALKTIQNRCLDPRLLPHRRNYVFHQPAVWLSRQKVLDSGGIAPEFHYLFDWELMIRYLANYPRVTYTTNVLARFRIHDQSKTGSEDVGFREERGPVLEKLAELEQMGPLRPLCRRLATYFQWEETVDNIALDFSASNVARARRIFREALSHPDVRSIAYALRMIRRCLCGRYRSRDVYERFCTPASNNVTNRSGPPDR